MEMKKYITDERKGISRTLQGEYYLSDLLLPRRKVLRFWAFRHSKVNVFAEISQNSSLY